MNNEIKFKDTKIETILIEGRRDINNEDKHYQLSNNNNITQNKILKGKNHKMEEIDIKEINSCENKKQSFNALIIPNNNKSKNFSEIKKLKNKKMSEKNDTKITGFVQLQKKKKKYILRISQTIKKIEISKNYS